MKRVIGTLSILATLCMAKDAFYAELERGKSKLTQKVFNHYDRDKNTILSFKEFSILYKEAKEKAMEKRAKIVIKSCDKNGNGKIDLKEAPSIEEMQKIYKKSKMQARVKMCRMNKEEFKYIDKDNNKVITKGELIDSYKRPRWSYMQKNRQKIDKLKIFKTHLKEDCDKNKDGKITLKEATSMRCYMDSDTFIKYSGGADKSFKISDVKDTPKDDTEERIKHLIKMCDKNGDLKLNLVEATSKWCQMSYDRFEELNKNRDNYLSKSELMGLYKEYKESNIATIEHMKDAPAEVQISFALGACDADNSEDLSRQEAKKCKLSMKIFNKFDYDKNAKIDKSDMDLMAQHRTFKMTDTNSDGKIDFKEFSARMSRMCVIF